MARRLALHPTSSPPRPLARGLLLNTLAPGAGLSWIGQPRWHGLYALALLLGAALALQVGTRAQALTVALIVLGLVLLISTVHTVLAHRHDPARPFPTLHAALIVTHLVLGLGGTLGGAAVLLVQQARHEQALAHQHERRDYTHEVYAAVLAANALGHVGARENCAGGLPGFPVPKRADVTSCTAEAAGEPQVDIVFTDGAVYSLP